MFFFSSSSEHFLGHVARSIKKLSNMFIERVEALRLSTVKVEKVVKKLQCSKGNFEMILIEDSKLIETKVAMQRFFGEGKGWASTRMCSQVVMNES